MTDDPHRLFRTTDPPTSEAAARAALPGAESLRWRIFDTFCHQRSILGPSATGLTDERLCAMYPANAPSGVRTRRHELVAAGVVEDSGRREPLASGLAGIVWRASDIGWMLWRDRPGFGPTDLSARVRGALDAARSEEPDEAVSPECAATLARMAACTEVVRCAVAVDAILAPVLDDDESIPWGRLALARTALSDALDALAALQ